MILPVSIPERNHTTRFSRISRNLLVLLCLLLPAANSAGIDYLKNYVRPPVEGNLSFDLYSEMRYGVLKEYVYSSSAEDAELLSRLDWEVQPSFAAGMHAELTLPYRLFIGGKAAIALPMRSGSMVNRDWISGNPPLSNDDPDSPTHYSEHNAHLTEGYAADVYIGYSFHGRHWSIEPAAGFQAWFYDFDGRDGFYLYPYKSGVFEGSVITYQQLYYMPYVRSRISLRLPPRLQLQFTAAYSPLTAVDALDHHILRNTKFYDSPRCGTMLESHLRISLQASEPLSVWLSIGGSIVPPFRGDTDTLNTVTGAESSSTNGGGASLQLLHISAGIRLKTRLWDTN